MKANQFLRNDDDAVSPVIAVILMVAITVVLAATVYVWVSGFGSNSNSSPAHTMSLVSAGAVTAANLQDPTTPATVMDSWSKKYTVSSASPSLTYEDMTLTIGGTQYAYYSTACSIAHTVEAATTTHFRWGACAGATIRAGTDSVRAGDIISVSCFDHDPDTASSAGDPVNCLNDKDLLFLDTESNSIMVSLKVR